MPVKINKFYEAFLKKMPMIMQTEVADCGLACLAMISSWHGHKTNVFTLRKIFDISSNGMTVRHMMSLASKINLDARAARLELKDLKNTTLPCILHWSFNHFVVLVKITKNGAVIHDPAIGMRKISLTEISNKFTGILIEFYPRGNFKKVKITNDLTITDMFNGVLGFKNVMFKVAILSLIVEALALSTPLASQFIIDIVFKTSDMRMLNFVLFGLVLLIIMRTILSIIRAWTLMSLRYSLGIQWYAAFINKLLKIPIVFFAKRHSGDISSRLTSLNAIQNAFSAEMITSLLDIFILAVLGLLLFNYSPVIALLTGLLILAYVIFKFVFYNSYLSAQKEAIFNEAQQNSHFLETVRGVACVKIFGLSDIRRTAWLNLVISTANARAHLFKIDLLAQSASAFLAGLTSAMILFIGGYLLENGSITVGILFACLLYADIAFSRSIKVINSFFDLNLISMHTSRLSDFVFADTECTKNKTNKILINKNLYGLSISNLSFKHSDFEPHIFESLNFSIHSGESVAIVGPSGCGKSTLLNVLAGLSLNYSGDILIGDNNIKDVGIEFYRKHIAYVMQDDKLFAGSLLENISAFDPEVDLNWLYHCTTAAAIHDEILSMPLQYETMVGDMGSILSGGQKQRISLARALYKRPNILFLDEATSDLDVSNERKIIESIKLMSITRIFVAHRPDMIVTADRIYNLREKIFSQVSDL